MDEKKVTTGAEKAEELVRNVFAEELTKRFGDINDKLSGLDSIEEKVQNAISEVMKKRDEEKKIELKDNLEDDPKGGFKALWHFARDVARADKSHGRQVSKELAEWDRISKAAATTTLREDDAEYGGYLIPTEFRNDLMVLIEHENLVLPMCTPVPMSTNIIEIPGINGFDESSTVFGGIAWTWTDELGAYTEKRPKLQNIQLKLKKLTGLAYASDEVLADSPVSMEGLLRRGFASGLNYEYNKVFVRGTGAGQPLGVLDAPCTVSISKETGQAAGTLLYENIVKMYARVWNKSNCVWMANSDILPQLCTMHLAVGTGGIPVYMPANGAAGKPFDTLMGRPIVWNDHCSTVGTVGDIILGNWAEYLVARKAGPLGSEVRFDQSIHLKFDYGQVAFRLTTRIDGQPWWYTYYTPPQGTNYKSPFITLATRS